MSNCGFIQLSTYFKVQQLLTKEYQTGTAQKAKDFIKNFMENTLTNYVRDNYDESLTLEDADYLGKAMQRIIPMLQIVAPNPLIKGDFMSSLTSLKVQKAVNDSIDKKITILANRSSAPGVNTNSFPIPSNHEIVQSIISMNLSYSDAIDLGIKIKSKGDIDKLFYGAFNAQTKLEKMFAANMVNKFMIHSNGMRYNVTDSEIDTSVKNHKEDTFRKLVDHVNKQTGSKLDNKYYVSYLTGSSQKTSLINPELPAILNSIEDYYKGLSLTAKKIEAWESTNPTELEHYINFITLSNFDHLFNIYGQGIFTVADATFDSNTETFSELKYKLSIADAISGGFNVDELYPLLGEQTSIYKRFIMSMPIIDSHGGLSLSNKIDISSVNATIARVFQDIRDFNRSSFVYDKTDSLHSMKKAFEFFITNHFNISESNNKFTKEKSYSSGEQEVILSIYINFFSNGEADLEKILNPKLFKAITEVNPDTNKSVLTTIGRSAYQLSVNTNKEFLNHKFSPVNILVSNFNKTYFNKYTQIVYNSTSKGIMFETLDNQLYEGDVIWLKNTVDGTANIPIGLDNFNKMMKNVKVDSHKGEIRFSTKEVTLQVNLTDNTIVAYNNSNQVITLSPTDSIKLLNNKEFLTTLENLTGIHFDNRNLISALMAEFDSNTGAINTIHALSKIAAAGAIIRTITNKPIEDRETFIKVNDYLSSRPSLFNVELDEYQASGVYGTYNTDMTSIAKAFSSVNGTLYKAVVKTANGKTMPAHAEVRHIYVIQDLIDHLNSKNVDLANFPLEKNLFVKNRSFLKSPVIRTYIKDMDEVKHSSELSPLEHTTAAIIYEYFGSLNTSGGTTAYIQPTVFTDKNMHYSIPINFGTTISVLNNKGGMRPITLATATPTILKETILASNKNYYNNLAMRILVPYVEAARMAYGVKGLNSSKHAILKEGYKFNTKNIVESFNQLEKIMNELDEATFRNSFYAVHGNNFPFMDELGFKTKPKFGLSESLLGYVSLYNSPATFDTYVDRARDLFIRDLEEMHFKMEYFNSYGSLVPTMSGLFASLNPAITDGMNETTFMEQWVDPNTGYIINSKVENGKNVLNPLLENFFLVDSFISESYQQVSMGTASSHPTKGTLPKPGSVEPFEHFLHVISLKTKAGFKRHLEGTPGKPLNQGLINGVSSELKVVSLTDVDLPTYNSFGIEDKMTVTDGAKLTPMVQIILQNNSFQDNSAGVNQKTLSNTLDPYYGALDQDKCAEHALTNEMTRRSKNGTNDIKFLYQKAYGIPFSESIPAGRFLNLLRDYEGKPISIKKQIAPDGLFFARWNPIITKEHPVAKYDIIEVVDITNESSNIKGPVSLFVSNDQYKVRYKDVVTGQIKSQLVPINSLFDLWQVIGAENSVSLHEEGNIEAGDRKFVFSDSSHEALVEFINSVGTWTTASELNAHGLSTEFVTKLGKKVINNNVGRMPTQAEVWQPLKDSFINTFAFHSGEKAGSMSTQTYESVFDKNPNASTPIYFKQSVLSTLLLLKSEHDVDDAELTEMSQIVSALIFNSETLPYARRAYTAISKLIDLKLRNFVKGISEFKEFGNNEVLYNEVVKMLINQFKNNDQKSIATLLANMAESHRLTSKIAEGNQDVDVAAISAYLSSPMPISSYIYSQFVSMLASTINRDAVKRQYAGIASVLKTSGSFVQVYDVENADGTYSTVTSDIFHTKHAAQITIKPTTLDEISAFEWVQLEGEEPILLDTNRKLLDFRRRAKVGPKVEVFKGNWNRQSVANDVDKVYLFGDNTNDRLVTKHIPASTQAQIRGLENTIGIDTKKDRGTRDASYLSDADYDTFVAHVEQQIQAAIASGKTIVIPADGIGTGKAMLATKAPKLFEYLQNRLAGLQSGESKNVFRVFGKPRELKPLEIKFSVLDEIGNVKIKNFSIYDTEEFEIVLGLMDLATPGRKKDTFEAKQVLGDPIIMQKVQALLGAHEATAEYYQKNGELIQLKAKQIIQNVYRGIEKNKLITIKGVSYKVADIVSTPGEALGPNIYRKKFGLPEGISIADVNVNTFFEILKKNSSPVKGTEAANRYIRHLDGSHIYIFTSEQLAAMPNRFLDASNRIRTIDGEKWVVDKSGDKEYLVDDVDFKTYVTANGVKVNAIVIPSTNDGSDPVVTFMENNDLAKRGIEVVDNSVRDREKMDASNMALANKILSSFHVSLEFTAARIPGQGPQSFTALKLVDFMHETNTIMTNHFTTWLKGEDYDIDKGFWLGVNVDKSGMVSRWSKEFDFSSAKALKSSLRLPIPDGNGKIKSHDIPGSIQVTFEEAKLLNTVGMTDEKAELLSKIDEAPAYYIAGIYQDESTSTEVMEEENQVMEKATAYIDSFFGEKLKDKFLEEAYKNKVARSMFDMITSPINQVHAESPISFGELVEYIKSLEPKLVSPSNFTTKAIIQDANMVGKAVVGIAAVGLKVWSALSYWGNHKLLEGKTKDILVGKTYNINGEIFHISTIANLNFNNGMSYNTFVTGLSEALGAKAIAMGDDSKINVEEFIKEYARSVDLSVDESLTISAMLSAATDNAKELILQSVNGGKGTAGIYMYLSMLGIPLKSVIGMMTNKEVNRLTELSKKNIFDKNTAFNSLNNSYNFWLKGPESFRNTFPTDSNNIEEEYRDIINDMDIPWTDQQKEYLNTFDTEKKKYPMKLTVPNISELLSMSPETSKIKIDDFLSEIKSKLEMYYIPRTYMSEEQQEMMNDVMEEGEGGTPMTKYSSSRFIDKLLSYYNDIYKNITDTDREIVRSFMEIANDAEEITLLGGILASNQGIKSDSYTQYAFLKKFDKAFFSRFDDVKEYAPFDADKAIANAILEISNLKSLSMDDAADKVSRILTTFTFKKYIEKLNDESDPEFVELSKIIYGHLKKVVNILDIVDTVPQYKKMLKATIVMDGIKDALTSRDRTINNLITELHDLHVFPRAELKSNGITFSSEDTLQEDVYNRLHGAFDDILTVKWLRTLPDNRKIFKVNMFEEVVIKGTALEKVSHVKGKDVIINLGTTEGRANFLAMFPKLIYDLKQNPSYSDNAFIKGLGTDKGVDKLNGTKYKFFRLPINLMNITEHNINEFNMYVTDFNKLDSIQFGNMTIKDAFFVYNMLIHRDRANKASFTKLFEKDSNLTENSLFFNYINTVASLDKTGYTLKNVEEDFKGGDYRTVDILARGISPKIDPKTTSKAMTKYVGDYAHMITKKGDVYVTEHLKWSHGSNKYETTSYLNDFITVPLSVDFPGSIEILNKVRDQLTKELGNAISKINSLIEDLQINCK